MEESQQEEINSIYQQATEALEEKYYYKALNFYQETLLLNKKSSYPYIKTAEIHEIKQDFYQSEKILKEGIQNVSDKDELYLSLGKLYLKSNNLSDAEKTLKKIDNPINFPEKNIKLAEIYYKQNNKEKAMEKIEELLSENEIDNTTKRFLETKYLQSLSSVYDNPQEALTILNQGNFTEEILLTKTENLKEILNMEVSNYQKLLLSQELINQGFPALIIPEVTKIIKAEPEYRDAYLVLGTAHFESENKEEAKTIWEKAIEKDPAHGENHFLLSQYYLSQKNIEKAELYAERASYIEPKNSKFSVFLATLHFQQNNCEKAIREQERVVNQLVLWQSQEEIINNQISLVNFYLECNNFKKAVSLSEKLKNSQTPTELDQQILDLHAWSFWKKDGNKEQSTQNYQTLLSQYPNESIIHWHYSKILRESGNIKQADIEKNRAYELDIYNTLPSENTS